MYRCEHLLTRGSSTLTSFSLFSTCPSLTGSGSRLSTSGIHCADSRGRRGDGFTDPEPRIGKEPNRTVDDPIVTEQEIEHSTEESQIPEIEDKFSLPYNQSFLSFTLHSMESLAMPQEADLDHEQIRALLASSRYSLERGASAERLQFYEESELHFKSLNFIGKGKLVAWLSHHKRLGQERTRVVQVIQGCASKTFTLHLYAPCHML